MTKSLAKIPLLIFFIIAFIIPSLIKDVHAICLTPGPDEWFTETFILNQTDIENLPANVQVSKGKYYGISNTSSSPIYIVSKPIIYDDPDDMPPGYIPYHEYLYPADAPVGYIPRYKITDKTVYEDTGIWNDRNYSELTLSHNFFFDFGINPNNIRKDNRPENIVPPAPEPFEIVIIYEDAEYVINGFIEYSINSEYDPLAEQKGRGKCSEYGNGFDSLIFPLVILGVVLMVIILFIFVFKLITKKNVPTFIYIIHATFILYLILMILFKLEDFFEFIKDIPTSLHYFS